MARLYKEITQDELVTAVKKLYDGEDFPYDLPHRMFKDIEKCQLNWENYTDVENPEGFGLYTAGFKDLGDGLHVFIVNVGGDWEYPVALAIYMSENGLRAYIPSKGNAWDKTNGRAFNANDEVNGEYDAMVDNEAMMLDIKNRIKKKI